MKTILIILLSFTFGYSQRAYNVLEVSYLSLNVADIISTCKVLNAGGVELNHVMTGSKFKTISIKTCATLGQLAALRLLRKENKKASLITLGVLNAGMSFVVFHNYMVYFKIRI